MQRRRVNFGKIAQCEDGQKGRLPTCSITDNHQFSISLSAICFFHSERTSVWHLLINWAVPHSPSRFPCPLSPTHNKKMLPLARSRPRTPVPLTRQRHQTKCQFRPTANESSRFLQLRYVQCCGALRDKPRRTVKRETGGGGKQGRQEMNRRKIKLVSAKQKCPVPSVKLDQSESQASTIGRQFWHRIQWPVVHKESVTLACVSVRY